MARSTRPGLARYPPQWAGQGRLASLFEPPRTAVRTSARPGSTATYRSARSRAAARMVQAAAWAVPAYAVVQLWEGLRSPPRPGTDPLGWAGRVTTEEYLRTELLAGLGGGILALVGLAAVAGLLVRGHSLVFTVAGALAGLAGVALVLPRLGVVAFTAPPAGQALLAGDPAAVELYRQAYDQAALPAQVGTVLLGVAWLVLGLAVWRSRVLGRADGLLLMLAAPLLSVTGFGVAGLAERLIVPLGALLLAAGGIGIAWSGAGRSARVDAGPQSSDGAGD